MNAETGGSLANDRGLTTGQDGGCGTKSPWKMTPSPAVTVDAPIMGAHSWPALADAAQQPRSKNPPPLAPTSTPTPSQPVAGQANSKAGGKDIPGHKNPSGRHSKSGSRSNPIVPPPYPVHAVPYHPPLFPPMLPLPYAAGPVYTCALYPPYPILGAPITEPGNEKAVQATPPPSVLPGPQGNPGQPWQHQRGFDPRNMSQGAGPRNFVRPPYTGPAPGFLVGPTLPGLVCFLPPPIPGAIRAPYTPRFAPTPVNQDPPEKLDLGHRVRKQIEFYFSDENLETDNYLISLMDEKGWVPAKIIAGFKRVKAMTMDFEFVVYALGFSASVEVQKDKIRKRNTWYKWVPASKRSASEEKIGDSGKDSPEIITSGGNSGNHSQGSIKPTVCDCSSEGAQSSRTNNYESDNMKSSAANGKRNVDDLSSDFVNTVLLDEKSELEHRNPRKSGLSASKSIEYEGDDTAVNGHDFQKLVMVTRNNEKSDGSGTSGTRATNIAKEVASTINDGLYYFEQEIKMNRSGRWKNNSHLDNPGGNINNGGEELGIINHKHKGKQVSLMM